MSGFLPPTTAMVIGAALLGLAATVPVPANFNVHEWMTVEEIRQVFQADPHTIPEYEVTPIQWPKLHKRAAEIGVAEETATHITFNAFGRDVPLWLQPVDEILAGADTPVYYARADENGTDGVRFDKIPDPMSEVGRILEDKAKKATLVVKQEANGQQVVFGNIGSEKWTIRVLPSRFEFPNNEFQNYSIPKISLDDNYGVNITFTNDIKPRYHVIYVTPIVREASKYASPTTIGANLRDTTNSLRSKRATNIPSVIYPQILVVVDYATYQRHNGDTNALLEYLLLFWNAVDLRYRGFQNPKIRFNIAGVIIEADPNTLPYIQEHKVEADKLDIMPALRASGIFRRKIESTFPLDSYDIIITMTTHEMCNALEPGCPVGISGQAFYEGACQDPNWPYRYSTSAAIIRDLGVFNGVHYAAHELAHLFGADHDDALEGPCSLQAGYTMAESPQLSGKSEDWSPCTLNAFDAFFRRQESVCLFNKPSVRSPMPRVLPGRLQTMDDQCMKIKGTRTCINERRIPPSVIAKFAREICMKLRCYNKEGTACIDYNYSPADGSSCGEGKICLHSKCIQETELSRTNDTKLP